MRSMRVVLIAALVIGFALSSSAFAQKTDGVQIKPWGQVFAEYNYNFSGYKDYDPRFNDNDFNQFQLTRTRLGLDAQLTSEWFGSVVLDADRAKVTKVQTGMVPTGVADDPTTAGVDESQQEVVTGIETTDTGAYTPWVTYAYMKYQPFRWFSWDFGMIYGAAGKQLGSVWRYRYLMDNPMFLYGFCRIGDLGTAIDGDVSGGWGGYRVAVLNGEGKRAAEANAGKAVEAMIYLSPFVHIDALKGFKALGFYRYNKVNPDYIEVAETVWEGLLSYRLDISDSMGFSVNGEFVQRTQDFGKNSASPEAPLNPIVSQVWSAWADLRVATYYGLVFRYDSYDPNTENDKKKAVGYKDEQTTLLAGLWADPIKYVRISPNYRRVTYTAEIPDANGKQVTMQPDQYFYFNTEFNFK
jgi:uncharacterized membrane protein